MSRARNTLGWQTAVSVLAAIGLLAYFLWQAPLREVASQLTEVHLGWLLASIVLSLASYSLRALRWGIILRPVGRPPVPDLLGCTAAGFAANTLLPARAGELVRPLLLAARARLPGAATVASVVTERILDLATVLFLFALGAALSRSQLTPGSLAPLRDAALLTAAGLVAVVILVAALLRWRHQAVASICSLVPGRLRDSLARLLNHLLDGLAVVKSPIRLLQLTGWSLAVWLAATAQIAALARAFDLSGSLPVAIVVLTVGGLGLALPTPGGVGGFHAATQFALVRLYGVDPAAATAFALIHHAVCFFPITIAGLGYLAATGLTLGRARQVGSQMNAEEDQRA